MYRFAPESAFEQPVTLEALLASREARFSRQQAWRQKYKKPLISLTIVSPGEIKDSTLTRKLFAVAFSSVEKICQPPEIPLLKKEFWLLPTGAEALFSVDFPAPALKQKMTEIEESHPAGRLFDIDVFDTDGNLISRRDLGFESRRCLICDFPAAVCARNRSHSLPQLLEKMEQISLSILENRGG